MKKLFMFLAMWFAVNLSFSQAEPPQAPSAITDKFNNDHPGVPATWKKDGNNYQVNFVDPESNMGQIIVYDRNGQVIRRESELDNLAYPASINDYYIKHYPGEKYKTWSSEDQAGVRSYYIGREHEVVKFDKDGNPVPQKKHEPKGTKSKPSKRN